jgi:hypothetical protein
MHMTEVSHWMHVDHFTVNQAAALWCGYDPASVRFVISELPSEVLAVKQLLVGGIVGGALNANSSGNTFHTIGDYSKSLLTRADLERFARSKNLFPSFLFDTLAAFVSDPITSANPFLLSSTPTAKLVKSTSTPIANKGGRPAEYDWDSFMLEIVRRANDPDGLPDSQAELVRDMQQWFADKFESEPAESSVKSRISKIYKYLADTKEKAKNPGD